MLKVNANKARDWDLSQKLELLGFNNIKLIFTSFSNL
jgi:hypothetical protein